MRKESPLFVKVEQEKSESNLSSFGAISTFLEFLNGLKFDRMVGTAFHDESNQGYSSLHYILTVILLNLTGGQSVSDVERMEEDSGLKRVFKKLEQKLIGLKGRVFRKGRTRVFPSVSRIFSFLDRFNSPAEEVERDSTPEGKSKILPVADSFEGLVELNRSIVCQSQVLNPRQTATLDMDNNLIVTNKCTAKTSYKKERSYHPFNVYWAEQDLMLFSEFRDGNVPAGAEQLRILKESLSQLPSGVEEVTVRSDTAGYQHDLLEFMERGTDRFGKIGFSVSCDVSKSFRQAVLAVDEQQWNPIVVTDAEGNRYATNQEVAEVFFVPETKNKKKNAPVFRYLATREAVDIQYEFKDDGQISIFASDYIEQKLHLEEMAKKIYKIFGIVTNLEGTPLEIVLHHRQRCGKSEQEHSRLTGDMAGGRFPSSSFGENAAWWYLSIISLNLLKLFQRHTLPKELATARIKTLNARMFRVALKMVESGRQTIVKIGNGHSLFELISYARNKILELDAKLSLQGLWLENRSSIR
ncbi:MAG: IS1380 family transposase [Deltaproteobacteria bacterium]|nr:IS1380 family transposase [Deltaproteobacteria bacterium]